MATPRRGLWSLTVYGNCLMARGHICSPSEFRRGLISAASAARPLVSRPQGRPSTSRGRRQRTLNPDITPKAAGSRGLHTVLAQAAPSAAYSPAGTADGTSGRQRPGRRAEQRGGPFLLTHWCVACCSECPAHGLNRTDQTRRFSELALQTMKVWTAFRSTKHLQTAPYHPA